MCRNLAIGKEDRSFHLWSERPTDAVRECKIMETKGKILVNYLSLHKEMMKDQYFVFTISDVKFIVAHEVPDNLDFFVQATFGT